MIYVLYHSNCYDGFGAAFAAWKKFGHGAEYIPVSYGQEPPAVTVGSTVFIVDFSYSEKQLLKLAESCKVIVLDHHKTAQEALSGLLGMENPKVTFDMTKSGALLAWEHFHPYTDVPKLIQHISDRDLWQFKLEGSREIHKALVSLPFDFTVWDKLNVEELKVDGAAMTRLHDQLVDKTCEAAYFKEIGGHKVPVVNTSFAWSEVGERLQKLYPEAPFVASFTVFEDTIMWSLRSPAHFDVSEIAKKYGGGGHKNAAGFKAPRH